MTLIAAALALLPPTYLEFRCRDHPEAGWIIDLEWYGHLHTAHGVGVTVHAEDRKRPLPRPGHPMPQLVGWS